MLIVLCCELGRNHFAVAMMDDVFYILQHVKSLQWREKAASGARESHYRGVGGSSVPVTC